MKLPVALVPVEGSSNLHAVGYDEPNQHLYARFSAGGAVYRYFEVTPGLWALMQASERKGSFLAKTIKPGRKFEKIEPETADAAE